MIEKINWAQNKEQTYRITFRDTFYRHGEREKYELYVIIHRSDENNWVKCEKTARLTRAAADVVFLTQFTKMELNRTLKYSVNLIVVYIIFRFHSVIDILLLLPAKFSDSRLKFKTKLATKLVACSMTSFNRGKKNCFFMHTTTVSNVYEVKVLRFLANYYRKICCILIES